MKQPVTDDTWKILIVDDEPEVHLLTRTVLKDIRFDGRNLEFLSTYDSESTRRILREESDIALILLDVIMEEKDSGLKLVKYIRDDLGNKLTRIILRTAAPDEEPVKNIVVEYEINDYKEKIDLNTPRLYASIIKSLRNYRNMKRMYEINRELEESRIRLTKVIQLSSVLFGSRTMDSFFTNLLEQTALILGNPGRIWFHHENPGELSPADHFPKRSVKDKTVYTAIENDLFIGKISSGGTEPVFLLADGCPGFPEDETQMLEVFFSNANIVYNNLYLKEDFQATQSEMIGLLGNVVENRSRELSGHQERVSDYALILARKLNIPEEVTAVLKDAVKLHDTGKIGIFDSILDKPGPLTTEEFETMKSHTTIGYEILRFSSRKLFQMAASIAWEHHEKWDGSGYPRGLAGEEIGQLGRITCIVDVFDALSSDRVYRKAWEFDKTIKFIEDGKGSQFDPQMVELFLEEKDRIRDILNRDTI